MLTLMFLEDRVMQMFWRIELYTCYWKKRIQSPTTWIIIWRWSNFIICIGRRQGIPINRLYDATISRQKWNEKRIYNYRLSRARRTVQNVFSILASQWQLLRRPILAKVSNATKIVQTIVCLYNWLRRHDVEREIYIRTCRSAYNRRRYWRRILEKKC